MARRRTAVIPSPPGLEPARGLRLAERRQQLIDRGAERSLRTASAADLDDSSRSLAGVVILVMATAVHLLTTAWLLTGLWLVLLGPIMFKILGGICLLVVVGTAPRLFSRVSTQARATWLTAETAPVLFATLASVGSATGAPTPDAVRLSADFNASVSRRGRSRVLELGAPLWVALSPQGRVALLGHELGHLAHRDLTDGGWVSRAMETVEKWRLIGATRSSRRGFNQIVSPGRGNSTALLEGIAVGWIRWIAGSYLHLMGLVNASAHRRREYLADLDAIEVAGSEGAMSLLDTILAVHAVETAIVRASLRAEGTDMWDEIRRSVWPVDDQVRLRRRHVAEVEKSRVDDSHPVTSRRIRLVEGRAYVGPSVQPTGQVWAQIDRELGSRLRGVATHLRSRQTSSR